MFSVCLGVGNLPRRYPVPHGWSQGGDWPYVTQLPCEPAILKIACTGRLHISEDEGTHGFHAHNCHGNTVIVFVPIVMEKSLVFHNQEILGRI